MEKSVDIAALPIFSAIRETFDIRKGDINIVVYLLNWHFDRLK